jgi:hypothetical protein
MSLGIGTLILAGLVVYGISILIDILFLKKSYQRASGRSVGWGAVLLQWVFLLVFNIIILVPMVLIGVFSLLWGFVISIITSIALMKFSADLAYKKKHTFTEGFHQWAWLMLYRIVLWIILWVVFMIFLIVLLL